MFDVYVSTPSDTCIMSGYIDIAASFQKHISGYWYQTLDKYTQWKVIYLVKQIIDTLILYLIQQCYISFN